MAGTRPAMTDHSGLSCPTSNSSKPKSMPVLRAPPTRRRLEAVRVGALGKKGSVSELLKTLGAMSPEERRERGPLIKRGSRSASPPRLPPGVVCCATRRSTRGSPPRPSTLTLPGRESGAEAGRIHPITQVVDELTAIFADMGFAVAEGPDIETDDYNFTKLNFPEGHPAREMHGHVLLQPEAGRLAHAAAHPYVRPCRCARC